MTVLLSKSDAIAASKNTYTLCKPCGKCGTQERYVIKSSCVYCAKSRARAQWKNPEYAKKETEIRRARRASNPELRARKNAQNKKWAEANPEKMKSAIKNWTQRNKERVRENKNSWRREEYRKNPEYRMRVAMSGMVRRVLGKSGSCKESVSEQILGYYKHQLVKHIESQFSKNMNWDNYGEYWHIDHIIPVSHFFRIGEKRPEVINAMSNLMPLIATENQKKSDSLEFLL